MTNVTASRCADKSAASGYDTVAKAVSQHYPGLNGSVDAMLGVFGAMALARRTKPLSLIFEGGSGLGKTAVLQMPFPPTDSPLEQYVYRSDKFTPRSFVTHVANVKKNEI